MEKTKTWDNLTFADNFMFCKILESNPELCKQLLERLLKIKIDHLEVPQTEKTMLGTIESKSVRFDVYTKSKDKIFDVEMQTVNNLNLPKRARYYQSIIDVSNLNSGDKYRKLKDTYIIFICLSDFFDRGLPLYRFENVCLEDKSLKLNDGTFKLFFNAEDYDKINDVNIKTFLKFLKTQEADDFFTKKLKEKIDKAKENTDWRKQFMTWQQTIDEEKEIAREEGLAEGLAEGRTQAREETARNALNMNLSPEQVSQITSLPLSEVLDLQKELTSQPVN